jgi:hypothetical protein
VRSLLDGGSGREVRHEDPTVGNGRVLMLDVWFDSRTYGVHFQSKPATYGSAS